VMVLREGRKRQIRRSLLALGHPVRRLVRVRMGPLRLGDLPRGHARELTPSERRQLQRIAASGSARATRGGVGQRGQRKDGTGKRGMRPPRRPH